jgi:hypothetical protein
MHDRLVAVSRRMRKVLPTVVLVIVAIWIARGEGLTTVLNLRNFGAAGDGIADDGPALQRALDALADAGGGTLHIPPGRYAIATPVARDFSEKASAISIKGQGPGTAIDVAGNGSGLSLTSELIIKVGEQRIALALAGLETLLIRNMALSGIEGVRDDAHIVLRFERIERVHVEHCEFYGLASLAPGGSIVAAHESGLHVDATAFLGCATNSAHAASMIQNLKWKDVAITNTKFVDYGTRPDFYSKTPLAAAYSWIGLGDAQNADAEDAKGGASSRRDAVIRNVFLDEGAFYGITARPDLHSPSIAPFNVFISAIQMNVGNLGASGVFLLGADKVLIERSRFGWSHHADTAISLVNVNEAILDRLECVDQANTIRADADTERLLVINSKYETLDSAAPYTKEITTPYDPVQFVRMRYLDVLHTEPELHVLHDWAARILRCEGSPPCLLKERAAFAKDLGNAARRDRWGL